MKHVILGAGPAGVIAAETLRKNAPGDEIVVIGDEPEAPYSRMASPDLLIGNVGEEGTRLRHGADHYAKLGIVVRHGRAKSVDTVKRQVLLEDGSSVVFDRLLIATGSSPATPPIPGIEGPGVHPCWTLADAREIMALAKPGARVLQMGAGFIGCIIMEALAARGVKLSVVEMGDRMVPRMMGPTAGGMIKDWCEAKGVSVYTGARVEAVERPDTPAAAEPGLLGKIAQVLGFGADPAPAVPAAAAPDCGAVAAPDVFDATAVKSGRVPSSVSKASVKNVDEVALSQSAGGLARSRVLGGPSSRICDHASGSAPRQAITSATQIVAECRHPLRHEVWPNNVPRFMD